MSVHREWQRRGEIVVTGSVSGEGGGAKKVWFCADYIGKNAIFAAEIVYPIFYEKRRLN
jgi:hypothetical protein